MNANEIAAEIVALVADPRITVRESPKGPRLDLRVTGTGKDSLEELRELRGRVRDAAKVVAPTGTKGGWVRFGKNKSFAEFCDYVRFTFSYSDATACRSEFLIRDL